MRDRRAELLGLIDYLGLSMGEAAAVLGSRQDNLSKRLSGYGRYRVADSEVAALMRLADEVDAMVATAIREISRRPPGEEITIRICRRDEDLPEDAGVPHASVHRLAMARIARACPAVRLVLDPAR